MLLIGLALALFTFIAEAGEIKRNEQIPLDFSRMSHPAYSYLSRLETLEDIPLISGTRPCLGFINHPVRFDADISQTREFSRYANEAFANHIVALGEQAKEPSRWSTIIQAMPKFIRNQQWLYGTGHHFAAWNYDDRFTSTVQPVYGYEVINTDDKRGALSRFTGGLRVEGGYAKRIRYMVDFRDHTESGNSPYNDSLGRGRLFEDRWAVVDLKGSKSASYDISESFIQYYGRDLSVAAGRGIHRWGPGQFGGLFLNSKAPPFDYFRFDAVMESSHGARSVNYTFLHGFLESATPAETLNVSTNGRPRTINSQKYLSAQRLEIRARKNLMLGFSQGVVYGDRGVQLGYLTPLSFLYSVQHSNDDKDNLILAFDGKWRVLRGLKLYAEAFFDDVVVSDLLKSTGNNKSAFTVGAHVVGPTTFWRHFDLQAEYTKIRPFVYSHVFATNKYTHWTSPLGYTLEPNSEFMTIELRGIFYPVQVTLHASRQNHGANSDGSAGGNIDMPRPDDPHNPIYPFLGGDLVRTSQLRTNVDYEILENLHLFVEGSHIEKTGEKSRFQSRFGFGWNL
jgi:hypothetical protein